mmetsp:Transcript_27123/g.70280  ORF Transcript_27123/g.70280 Transcript_27123/m.70280 type:complete len:244 (+) Transcript_27123:430-1161(+)
MDGKSNPSNVLSFVPKRPQCHLSQSLALKLHRVCSTKQRQRGVDAAFPQTGHNWRLLVVVVASHLELHVHTGVKNAHEALRIVGIGTHRSWLASSRSSRTKLVKLDWATSTLHPRVIQGVHRSPDVHSQHELARRHRHLAHTVCVGNDTGLPRRSTLPPVVDHVARERRIDRDGLKSSRRRRLGAAPGGGGSQGIGEHARQSPGQLSETRLAQRCHAGASFVVPSRKNTKTLAKQRTSEPRSA